MKNSSLLLLMMLATARTLAQTPDEMPRTPRGDPDLNGYWAHGSVTPLARPRGFEDRPVLPPDQAAVFQSIAREFVQRKLDRTLSERRRLTDRPLSDPPDAKPSARPSETELLFNGRRQPARAGPR